MKNKQKNSAAYASATNNRDYITKKINIQVFRAVIRKSIDLIMFVWLWAAIGGADSMELLPLVLFITPPYIWLFMKGDKNNV